MRPKAHPALRFTSWVTSPKWAAHPTQLARSVGRPSPRLRSASPLRPTWVPAAIPLCRQCISLVAQSTESQSSPGRGAIPHLTGSTRTFFVLGVWQDRFELLDLAPLGWRPLSLDSGWSTTEVPGRSTRHSRWSDLWLASLRLARRVDCLSARVEGSWHANQRTWAR